MCLKFGNAVDRRTFEKVVGATGGILGGVEGGPEAGEWAGLRSLELGFHDRSAKRSRRDEVRFNISLSLFLHEFVLLFSYIIYSFF